jgi:hypothetical protein
MSTIPASARADRADSAQCTIRYFIQFVPLALSLSRCECSSKSAGNRGIVPMRYTLNGRRGLCAALRSRGTLAGAVRRPCGLCACVARPLLYVRMARCPDSPSRRLPPMPIGQSSRPAPTPRGMLKLAGPRRSSPRSSCHQLPFHYCRAIANGSRYLPTYYTSNDHLRANIFRDLFGWHSLARPPLLFPKQCIMAHFSHPRLFICLIQLAKPSNLLSSLKPR